MCILTSNERAIEDSCIPCIHISLARSLLHLMAQTILMVYVQDMEALGSLTRYPFRFCDGEINTMVEGSRLRESHTLKILS